MSSRGVQPRGDLNPHRVILSAAKNLTSYSPLRLPHPSAEGFAMTERKASMTMGNINLSIGT